MPGLRYSIEELSCSVPPYLVLPDIPHTQQEAINIFAANRFMTFKSKDKAGVSFAVDNIVCLEVEDGLVSEKHVPWVFGSADPSSRWALVIAPPMQDSIDVSRGSAFYEKMYQEAGSPSHLDSNPGDAMTMAASLPAVASAVMLSSCGELDDEIDLVACVAAEWCSWEKQELLVQMGVPVLYDGSGLWNRDTLGYEELISFEYSGEDLKCRCSRAFDRREIFKEHMLGLAALNLYRIGLDSSFAYIQPEGRRKLVYALSCGHLLPKNMIAESQYGLYDMVYSERHERSLADEVVSLATRELQELAAIWEDVLSRLGASLSYKKFREVGEDPVGKAREMYESAQALGIPHIIDAYFSGVPSDDLMA